MTHLAKTLEHLIAVYAGCIAALHSLIGFEVCIFIIVLYCIVLYCIENYCNAIYCMPRCIVFVLYLIYNGRYCQMFTVCLALSYQISVAILGWHCFLYLLASTPDSLTIPFIIGERIFPARARDQVHGSVWCGISQTPCLLLIVQYTCRNWCHAVGWWWRIEQGVCEHALAPLPAIQLQSTLRSIHIVLCTLLESMIIKSLQVSFRYWIWNNAFFTWTLNRLV